MSFNSSICLAAQYLLFKLLSQLLFQHFSKLLFKLLFKLLDLDFFYLYNLISNFFILADTTNIVNCFDLLICKQFKTYFVFLINHISITNYYLNPCSKSAFWQIYQEIIIFFICLPLLLIYT